MALNILPIELILACYKEQNISLRLLKQRHFHDQWQVVSTAECLTQEHLYQFTFSAAYSSGAAIALGRRKWDGSQTAKMDVLRNSQHVHKTLRWKTFSILKTECIKT
jgi:hypothetical protein